MADRAELLSPEKIPHLPPSTSPSGTTPPKHLGPAKHLGKPASLIDVQHRLLDFYADAKTRTSRSLSALARRSNALMSNVRMRARRTRDENPLMIVAGVAVTAFAAGILLRIWRSRQS